MKTIPNFFIVGAPRTGTHSLYSYLEQHPMIFMSPRKEPNYFCREVISNNDPINNPIRDENEYFSLFKDVKNEIAIGEASVTYLRDSLAPKLIHEKIPNAKIIILLRDPAERALSHYLTLVQKNITKKTFYEEIKDEMEKLKKKRKDKLGMLSPGFYYESIKSYYEIFDKNNIMIIISEEFEKNLREIMRNVLEFLSIQSDFQFNETKKGTYRPPPRKEFEAILTNRFIVNIGKKLVSSPKIREKIFKKLARPDKERPKMTKDERVLLKKIYFEDMQKTKKFLSRDLPWKTLEIF